MGIRIPEKHKKPGVCYAVTEDGLELPVVDVTHPAFAVDLSPAEVARLTERFFRETKHRQKIPGFLQRLLASLVLRRSLLGRGLLRSHGTFLNGSTTYLLKVGAHNLGSGYAGLVDRRIAASLPGVAVYWRLEDMARLLADGLAPALRARPGRPCHLLNLGGGPAADSWNALILLRREHPELLAGRAVRIHVLDLDEAGPAFGRRAVAALQAPGAPLAGMDVELQPVRYDWTSVERLREVLGTLEPDAVVAGSSEGGLFEYGTDGAIVANLEAFREGSPKDRVLVGSVTRADGPAREVSSSTGIATRPRGLAAFQELARHAGWAVATALERTFSDNVRLVRAD